jgi:chloramphenicol-sensitive protein RarD
MSMPDAGHYRLSFHHLKAGFQLTGRPATRLCGSIPAAADVKKGVWLGVGAYLVWGTFPIYWKLLSHVSASVLICHRIMWSSLLLLSMIIVSRQWKSFRADVMKPRVFLAYSIAGILITVNWLTYVWSVNNGFIIETSLGYFINPIISVLLGVIFLRERLRAWQWLPIGLAFAGVAYLTVSYGGLPWIALTLAFTFATYGFVKKISPLGPLQGLALETTIMLAPAFLYASYASRSTNTPMLGANFLTGALLIGGGVVTTIPLLLFAAATQRIPLSVLGILQYISPTIQFILGVVVYHEPFTHAQLIGFSIVWTALAIFAIEGFVTHRAPAPVEF